MGPRAHMELPLTSFPRKRESITIRGKPVPDSGLLRAVRIHPDSVLLHYAEPKMRDPRGGNHSYVLQFDVLRTHAVEQADPLAE